MRRALSPLTTGIVTEEHLPVLLWVHSGTACVVTDGTEHAVRAGQAVWVPAGTAHSTRTDAGGVVLPVFPGAPVVAPGLQTVRVVDVPAGWEPWLVSQFDFNRHHTRGAGAGDRDLLALVAPDVPEEVGGARRAGVAPVPMPYSSQARAVADSLVRVPRTDDSVHDLAARQNVSTRTLQRQFLGETGLSLSQWRTRARVAAAAALLDAGREVGWAGRDVGFETPAGFTRAFRRHVGISPQQYARGGLVPADTEPSDREERERDGARAPRQDPPPVPPRQVWSWVYDWHVLWWVYRGRVALRAGSREIVLRRGQAMWLPAGFSASVDELADGSILLPLGDRFGGADVGPADLLIHDLGHEDDAALLHAVLTEYTLFRPVDEVAPGCDLVEALFQDQFGHGRDRLGDESMTGVVAEIARSLRRRPADSRSLAAWAQGLGSTTSRISREFREQTGRTFPRWRSELRMSLARELLMGGQDPRVVSRTLGYASPSAFGQVFTTTHGVTPRQYQLRVCRRRVREHV